MEKKRVMLVNPYPYYASGIGDVTMYPPLGLAYIAAVLEKAGNECMLIDANVLEMGTRKVIGEVESYSPDILGVSANLATARAALEIADGVKSRSVLKVCGGPYPTSMPGRFLSAGFDVVVNGEGEITFLELASGRRLGKIDGISFLENKSLKSTRPRKYLADLDSLPFPAYRLLPPISKYRMISRKRPVAPLLTSRGCPYQCIYCTKNMFGSGFRARSPENVLEEVGYLVGELGARQIDILDDNFTFDMNRAARILEGMAPFGVAINCQVGVRADRMTPELVGLMRKAGVFKAGIGVESGDPEVLKRIGKSLELPRVVETVRLLRQNGIIVHAFFMLGLPYDTEESMQRTIDFAKKLDPHIASFSVSTPLPGTPLYDIVKENGTFLKDLECGVTKGFFGGEPSYEMGSLKSEAVRQFYAKAYREFYGRPRKILDLLSTARSLNELGWVKDSAVSIVKSIFS